MDEMNLNLPPELQAGLEQYYTAAQPDPDFAQRLQAQLCRQQTEWLAAKPSLSNRRRSLMQTLRVRPALALIVAVLALAFLSGIVYAVIHLAGFIPGIGFVKDVQSVLTTPIVAERTQDTAIASTKEPPSASGAATTALSSQNQDGITITIEQAVSETDRMAIAYTIKGLPADLFGPERAQTMQAYAEAHPDESAPEQIRLPDGTLLARVIGGSCLGSADLASSWFDCQLNFAPLPAGVNQFTLEIHRFQNSLPGELPEDWQIPVTLTSPEPGTSLGVSQEPNLCSQPMQDISLCLLKTSQTSAQSAFQFALQWKGQDRMLNHTSPIKLQDNQSRYYILTGGPDQGNYSVNNPEYSTLSSLVTTRIDGSSPLTFHMDWIAMSAFGQAVLQFKPGQNDKPGQEWDLDETFTIGEIKLHITKARFKAAADGQVTYEFDIEVPDAVLSINLYANVDSSTLESGLDASRGTFVSRITMPEPGSQPIELSISEVVYKVEGPWELTWQPEILDFSTAPVLTPAPTRLAELPIPGTPDNPLLSEIAALMQKAYPQDYGETGWVHQIFQRESSLSSALQYSSDALAMPQQTQVERWIHQDANGYGDSSILQIKSLDGKILWTDINKGVYYFSLPEGRGGIAQDHYLERPSYDNYLVSTISGYLSQGGTLTKTDAAVNGKPCALYEAINTYNPPVQFSDEPQPVQKMRYSACLDPQNGSLLQVQYAVVYEDGSTKIKETTQYLSLDVVETLPKKIQELLDSVIMP